MDKLIYFISLISILLYSCAPTTTEHYLKLASKKMRKGETDLAEINFKKALELDSLNIQAYNGLGNMTMNSVSLTDLDNSRKYFLKSLSIDSTKSATWAFMGYTYMMESGNMRNKDTINMDLVLLAIDYYDKAILYDKNNTSVYYQIGYCYNSIGDTVNSKINFTKACELGDITACQIIKK